MRAATLAFSRDHSHRMHESSEKRATRAHPSSEATGAHTPPLLVRAELPARAPKKGVGASKPRRAAPPASPAHLPQRCTDLIRGTAMAAVTAAAIEAKLVERLGATARARAPRLRRRRRSSRVRPRLRRRRSSRVRLPPPPLAAARDPRRPPPPAHCPTHPQGVSVEDTSGGCGAAFDVCLVSAAFSGKPPVARHRLVHDALKEEMARARPALGRRRRRVRPGVQSPAPPHLPPLRSPGAPTRTAPPDRGRCTR